MKKSVLFLLLSVILISSVFVPDAVFANTPKIDYVIAQTKTVKKYITLNGKITSKKENTQISDNNYFISKILVNTGDEVDVGDNLCEIDVEKTTALYVASGKIYSGEEYVKSDYAGVISEIFVSDNTTQKSGTKICKIIDTSDLIAEIYIPEENFTQIHKSQKIFITGNGFEKTYTAKINNIGSYATTDSTSLTFIKATAFILNGDENLKAGFNVKAKAMVKKFKNVIVINSTCIDQDANGEYVYLLNGNHLVKRYIKTDIVTSDGTVVLEGINSFEAVAINPDKIKSTKNIALGEKE